MIVIELDDSWEGGASLKIYGDWHDIKQIGRERLETLRALEQWLNGEIIDELEQRKKGAGYQ